MSERFYYIGPSSEVIQEWIFGIHNGVRRVGGYDDYQRPDGSEGGDHAVPRPINIPPLNDYVELEPVSEES